MTVWVANSQAEGAEEAAFDLKQQLAGAQPRCLLVFASTKYDPGTLAAAIQAQFGDVATLGCTSAGELITGKMLENSVSLFALGPSLVGRVATALISDPSEPLSVEAALQTLADGLGETSLSQLDPDRHIGIVLQDGTLMTEEAVMERLSGRSVMPFVGGSAGDDLKFLRTHVFHRGRAHPGASMLAALELPHGYSILKTQSFDVSDTVLTVTDVDELNRCVLRFDDKPATQAYAEALGVAEDALPSMFQSRPLGLVMPDGEPFVRSPKRLDGDCVVFYCAIKPGARLRVLHARDIVEKTRRDLAQALATTGPCAGLLNFHCVLRTLELREKNQTESYGALFKLPTAGLSTYGESYIGHINQTSTVVLFRKPGC